MSQFDYLKTLEVKDRTARYTMHAIQLGDRSPTLLVRPATEANKPYFNALLKRARSYASQLQANAVNESMLVENRNEDRAMYPEFIVVGWEDVVDSKGKTVEFTKEACADFLKSLPNWLFDDLRAFCGKPTSFLEASAAVNGETAGKN